MTAPKNRCGEAGACLVVERTPGGGAVLYSNRRPDERITLDPDEEQIGDQVDAYRGIIIDLVTQLDLALPLALNNVTKALRERDEARAELQRMHSTVGVLREIEAEREAQDAKWGEQNHPDGTGGVCSRDIADAQRRWTSMHAAEKTLVWVDILNEEVAEAYAETDAARLRAELVQVAAVAVAWAEAIDRRRSR